MERGRATTCTFRLTGGERERAELAAAQAGQTLSQYARAALVDKLAADQQAAALDELQAALAKLAADQQAMRRALLAAVNYSQGRAEAILLGMGGKLSPDLDATSRARLREALADTRAEG